MFCLNETNLVTMATMSLQHKAAEIQQKILGQVAHLIFFSALEQNVCIEQLSLHKIMCIVLQLCKGWSQNAGDRAFARSFSLNKERMT